MYVLCIVCLIQDARTLNAKTIYCGHNAVVEVCMACCRALDINCISFPNLLHMYKLIKSHINGIDENYIVMCYFLFVGCCLACPS